MRRAIIKVASEKERNFVALDSGWEILEKLTNSFVVHGALFENVPDGFIPPIYEIKKIDGEGADMQKVQDMIKLCDVINAEKNLKDLYRLESERNTLISNVASYQKLIDALALELKEYKKLLVKRKAEYNNYLSSIAQFFIKKAA